MQELEIPARQNTDSSERPSLVYFMVFLSLILTRSREKIRSRTSRNVTSTIWTTQKRQYLWQWMFLYQLIWYTADYMNWHKFTKNQRLFVFKRCFYLFSYWIFTWIVNYNFILLFPGDRYIPQFTTEIRLWICVVSRIKTKSLLFYLFILLQDMVRYIGVLVD